MTEVATLTLAEFLTARYAEDEAAARLEIEHRRATVGATFAAFGAAEFLIGGPFDPARVLAECEAKRRIVGSFQQLLARNERSEIAGQGRGALFALEDAVRFLALPYASHPDFRPEWRP